MGVCFRGPLERLPFFLGAASSKGLMVSEAQRHVKRPQACTPLFYFCKGRDTVMSQNHSGKNGKTSTE